MKIDGKCHCGAIAYKAEIDPNRIAICHCADCQSLSGTAFRTIAPVDEASFQLTSGTPKVYVKLADSGNRREQVFCGNCGSPLYAAAADSSEPRVLNLRLGTARQREQLVPKTQVWHQSALKWLGDIGQMKSKQKQ